MFISNRKELGTSTNVLLIPSTLIFSILVQSDYLFYQLQLFSIRSHLIKCLVVLLLSLKCKFVCSILKFFDSFFKRIHFYIYVLYLRDNVRFSFDFLCWFLALHYQWGIGDIFGKILLHDQLRTWKLVNCEVGTLFIS